MDGSPGRDPADDESSRTDDEAKAYRSAALDADGGRKPGTGSLEPAVRPVGETPGPTPSAGGPAPGAGEESPLRTVGVAAGLGIAGIVGLAVVSAVVGLAGTAAGLGFGALFVGSVAVGQYIGFIGLGLGYLRSRGFEWTGVRSYLGVRLPSLRELGVIVAGYAAILVLLAVVAGVASVFLPTPAENQSATAAAENPELIPALVVVMFLVVGPSEELLYRGIVQNRLREHLSAVPAIAIATAIFASVHVVALAGNPSAVAVTVLILFVPGLVLGVVYEYTGNLVVPWLLHSTHNSVLLALLLVGQQMEGAPGILTPLV